MNVHYVLFYKQMFHAVFVLVFFLFTAHITQPLIPRHLLTRNFQNNNKPWELVLTQKKTNVRGIKATKGSNKRVEMCY